MGARKTAARKKGASTIDTSVLDAFLPKQLAVSGVPLQPITFLHYIALERIESPLVSTGRECTARDVAAGLLLCSLPPDGVQSAMAGGVDAFWGLVDEFAGRMSVGGMMEAPAVLSAHLDRAFSTAMRPASGGDDDPDPLDRHADPATPPSSEP